MRTRVSYCRRIFAGNGRITGRFGAACVLSLVPCLLVAEGAAGGKEPSVLRVVVHQGQPGLITLEAREATLPRVLDELSGKTGVPLHHSVLPKERVTATCAGETVREVMECLLGSDADLLYRNRGGLSKTGSNARPEEIWVMGSSFAKRPRAGESAREDVDCAAAGVKGPRQARRDETGKLMALAGGADPAQRANAIASLAMEGKEDDPAVRTALEAGLSDEDPAVRAQAVYGLARREGAAGVAVLQQALRDPDASVRLMAVETAATDAEGAAVLQEALADEDETVRALAAMKLGEPEPADGSRDLAARN